MSRRLAYTDQTLRSAGWVAPTPADEEMYRGARDDDSDPAYPDRLIKYVPAEVLAFFIAASPLTDSDTLRWVVLAAGLVINLLVIADPKRSAKWTHALGAISFAAWVVGTTDYGQELLGMSESACSISLLIAVFTIPLIDIRLDRWARRR